MAYESERTATREEVATTLRALADGVAAGSVRLGEGEEAFAVTVRDAIDLEIEFETEVDGASLEVELEWETEESERSSTESERSSTVDAEAESPKESRTPVGSAGTTSSFARFEIFRDAAEEWRWRLVHRNGNIIATSGEGYTRKHNARKGLRSVLQNAPGAEIVEKSDD